MLNFFRNRHEKKALTDAQLADLLGTGTATASGIAVSAETALRAPPVAAAVRTIAETAATMPAKVVSVAADGREADAPEHPANWLLRGEANDWTSGFELIRQVMVDALTRDEGGLAWVNWVNGQPREIIRYRPGYIQANYPDDTLQPEYRIGGIVVNPNAIVHLRGPFEKSPLSLCREAIGVALVMEKHAGRLFGTSARPGGVIELAKSLGDEAAKKMLAAWKNAMEGSENGGKTGILWDGASWKPMAFSSVDAQFQQLRIYQLQEIARAFNIPAIMIGEMSRATWSNSAEMQRLFLMLCLEPWLKALESALRRALIAREDRRKFAIRFDRDDFSKVDLQVLATAINSLISSRVINPNTGREWLDLAPYEGGETYANPNTGASQPNAPQSNSRQTGAQSLDPSQEDPQNGLE